MSAPCVQSLECCWGGPMTLACHIFDACGCQVVRHERHDAPLGSDDDTAT